MKVSIMLLAALAASSVATAQAPAAAPPAAQASAGAQAASADFSTGEVRRVDKDAQKVTLRHGPIPHLGMGDMTMVFRVSDPALLDVVKAGDKVRFKADKLGGQYTVTALEPVR